jgi:hypothetical protein
VSSEQQREERGDEAANKAGKWAVAARRPLVLDVTGSRVGDALLARRTSQLATSQPPMTTTGSPSADRPPGTDPGGRSASAVKSAPMRRKMTPIAMSARPSSYQ